MARWTRHIHLNAIIGSAVVVAVSAGFAISGKSTTKTARAASPAPNSALTPSNVANGLQTDFESVLAKVRPAVVEISTSSDLGSGIIYDRNGDIVTNDHVVGTATTFQVTLLNGKTFTATLRGAFPADDLAVVRVNGSPTLPAPATFANSSLVRAGEIVMAIGNPLGLASSVTDGIVSFNGRTVSEPTGAVLAGAIQTSAPINPGNSGGALVDLNASVVGIPTLAATNPELGSAAPGIGFAIPSNTVKRIAGQLVATGKVTDSGRAALGIEATNALSMSGGPTGVLVVKTVPNSAAAAAGIQPGDVITAVNGQPTPDLGSLSDVLAGLAPGKKVSVTVLLPSGSKKTYQVTLGQLTS